MYYSILLYILRYYTIRYYTILYYIDSKRRLGFRRTPPVVSQSTRPVYRAHAFVPHQGVDRPATSAQREAVAKPFGLDCTMCARCCHMKTWCETYSGHRAHSRIRRLTGNLRSLSELSAVRKLENSQSIPSIVRSGCVEKMRQKIAGIEISCRHRLHRRP